MTRFDYVPTDLSIEEGAEWRELYAVAFANKQFLRLGVRRWLEAFPQVRARSVKRMVPAMRSLPWFCVPVHQGRPNQELRALFSRFLGLVHTFWRKKNPKRQRTKGQVRAIVGKLQKQRARRAHFSPDRPDIQRSPSGSFNYARKNTPERRFAVFVWESLLQWAAGWVQFRNNPPPPAVGGRALAAFEAVGGCPAVKSSRTPLLITRRAFLDQMLSTAP